MPAHALGVPVVHRREGPDPALVGREHPHAVGAPHDVGRRGDNRPVVRFGVTLPAAVGREQPLRAHHAQHPRPGDPHPVEDPQPRVDLAMALALERGAGQVAANGRQQLRIRQRGRRPAAPRASTPRWALQASPPRVERRARPFPQSTHPLETIAPPRRRGGRCAHRRDLRVAKGRRRSAARARSRNSSFSIRQFANVSLGSIQLGGQRLTGLRLQIELETGQRTGLPRLQAIDLQTDFSRDRIKRLAAQKPQNHVPFPARAPPLLGR